MCLFHLLFVLTTPFNCREQGKLIKLRAKVMVMARSKSEATSAAQAIVKDLDTHLMDAITDFNEFGALRKLTVCSVFWVSERSHRDFWTHLSGEEVFVCKFMDLCFFVCFFIYSF